MTQTNRDVRAFIIPDEESRRLDQIAEQIAAELGDRPNRSRAVRELINTWNPSAWRAAKAAQLAELARNFDRSAA
ncbi:MAG: hypothetical protein WAS07_03920 [Micropruina sp.]